MDIRDIEQTIAKGDPKTFTLLTGNHFDDLENLKDNIVAFLNAKGGTIILGTDSKKKITGLVRSRVEEIKKKITQITDTAWDHPIKVNIEEISIPDNKYVILIKVPEGSDKPYFANDGRIYVIAEQGIVYIGKKALLMEQFFSDYKEFKEAMNDFDFNSLPLQVRALIKIMTQTMSREKLMDLCGRKDTDNFINNYINPALEAGIIERTIPDKPTSPHQEYFLTKQGIALRKRK